MLSGQLIVQVWRILPLEKRSVERSEMSREKVTCTHLYSRESRVIHMRKFDEAIKLNKLAVNEAPSYEIKSLLKWRFVVAE